MNYWIKGWQFIGAWTSYIVFKYALIWLFVILFLVLLSFALR